MVLTKLAQICLLLTAFVQAALHGMEKPSSIEELRNAIKEELDRGGHGSAGVALVSSERTIWADGIGIANPENGRRADKDTYWRVGSISKSFVGLATLILEERGVLRLTDPVADLAPEIEIRNRWKDSAPVRLVHLLEHTAGLDDAHPKHYASNDPTPLSLRQGLDFIKELLYCRWPPGLHPSYSNAGPAVAAYIVQKSDGRSFEDFVVEEIVKPLNMTGAGLLLTDHVESRLASGYGESGEQAPYQHIAVRPSGALNATPAQLARFVRMLLNRGELDGRRLVSPRSIDRMERPETTLAAALQLDLGYGLGNYSRAVGGFVFRGHNGGMPGYHSEYGYLPDQGLGYCVMVSTSNGSVVNSIRNLVRDFLIRDIEQRRKPSIAEMPGDIDQWTGYYRPITPRREYARFVERLDGVSSIRRVEDVLEFSRDGRDIEFHPAGNRVFKRKLRPMTTLALVEGPDRTKYVQGEFGNLRQVSGAIVWLERIVASLLALLMFSSPLWAVAWVPLRLAGRFKGRPVAVRLWPLLALISLAVTVAVKGISLQLIDELGQPLLTLAAISFVGLSWGFVLLAIKGLTCALRSDPQKVGRFARWHSLAVSLACLVAAVYLLAFRAIGFPPW